MHRVRLKPQGLRINFKTRLDEETVDDFCRLIKRGLPADAAIDMIGIGQGVYWDWLRRGEAYLNDPDGSDPQEKIYGYFVAQFKKAFAKYRLKLVTQAHKPATKGDWYRALELLSRRDRKTFGRLDPIGGAQEEFDPDDRFL